MKTNILYRFSSKLLLAAGLWLGLAIAASAQTLSNAWELSVPDANGDLAADNNARGLAYNSVSNQVILATRTGGNKAVVYDANTGALVGRMNMTGVSGGATFTWNAVACADDGVLYGFNVSASTFKIYRWATTDTNLAATVAYGPGDPSYGLLPSGTRWGDNVAIRGSGTSTEILVGSFANTNVALFTTTDGINFTPVRIDIPGINNNDVRDGLAFYTNNTFFAKRNGRPLILVQYSLTSPTTAVGTVLGSFTGLTGVGPIGCNPQANLLSTINSSTPGQLQLWDTSVLPPTLIASTNFLTSNANGNGTGATLFAGAGKTNRLHALWSNNGIKTAQILYSIPTPPTISSGPSGLTIYTNFPSVTFSPSVSGSLPRSYRWQFNSVDIPNATNASYTKPGPFTTADAGQFRVIITNAYGSITSSPATLAVIEPLFTIGLTPLWTITNGTRTYLQNDNNCRGLAYDPVTTNLVVVSRTGSTNAIYALSAETGADLFQLNTLGISGGTFGLNMIGVSAEGVVYAGNTTANNADGNFKLFRWPSVDSAAFPSQAFDASPAPSENLRWGDTLAVRGAGNDTQVLLGSFNGRHVALLTTTDGGATFTSTPMVAPITVPLNFAQLGIAFGSSNTFWAKASGFKLRHLSYDPTLVDPNLTLLAEYDLPSRLVNTTGIAIDTNQNALAAVEIANGDNVQLYRLSATTNAPLLLDQDFFATDNANGNATAAIAFSTNNTLYALDSNNGIKALTINFNPALPDLTITSITTTGIAATITWRSSPGGTYQLQAKDSLTDPTWNPVGDIVTASGSSTTQTDNSLVTSRYYRVMQLP